MRTSMLPIGGSGGIVPQFISPTYSNNNTTFSADWGFSADSVVVFGQLGANIVTMLIINGTVYAANNASLLYKNYGNFGGTINQTPTSIEFSHNSGWSNLVVCPISGTPTILPSA